MIETLTVAFFILGNLIGAGFFMMPASVAFLGFNLVWSWGIAAFIAFLFCFIFGRLYILYPESDDLSDYFEDFALKQTIAFLYWIGIIIGNVIVMVMMINSLKLESFSLGLLVAFLILYFICCGNYFINLTSFVIIESILSFMKFFLLLCIPLVVFYFVPVKFNLLFAAGSVYDVLDVSVLVFFSFMGIETAGMFGRSINARNGLFLGVFLCFLLYVFNCFIIVGVVPFDVMKCQGEIPLVCLLNYSCLNYYAGYVKYLVLFTSVTSLYGWFAISSKIALSYAKKGLFSSSFLVQTKSGGSSLGLFLSAILTFFIFVLISLFNVHSQFEILADFCVNIALIIFALCANTLYMLSSVFYDVIFSLIGIISIVLILANSFIFSLTCCGLFVVIYYIFCFLDQF